MGAAISAECPVLIDLIHAMLNFRVVVPLVYSRADAVVAKLPG